MACLEFQHVPSSFVLSEKLSDDFPPRVVALVNVDQHENSSVCLTDMLGKSSEMQVESARGTIKYTWP